MQGRAVSAFRGFPRELLTFFEGLCDDNSKDWTANKATWEEQVRQPMLALLADLADEFPPMRMFQPNRDVRFAKDKSPYKLWAGDTQRVPRRGRHRLLPAGVGLGPVPGCGAMAMASDQLQRFRAALDDADSGHKFEDPPHHTCRQITARDLRRRATVEDQPPLGTPRHTRGRSSCAGREQ